jgi:hypothetical protein
MVVIESRIRGIENESPFQTSPPTENIGEIYRIVDSAINGLRRYSIPDVIWLVEKEVGDLQHEEKILKNQVALNRFRIYNDLGHFERSTCSWRKPFDAVVYGLVGEVFDYLGIRSAQLTTGKEIIAHRNNAGKSVEGNFYVSCGTHYNILLSREACNKKKWKEFLDKLLPYFVTRELVTGIGGFVPTQHIPLKLRRKYGLRENVLKFVISPRSLFLNTPISLSTVGFRGVVNIRDEPHANPEKYWRYHDINDEAQRCIWQQYVVDCMQTLVFSAYEKGYIKNVPKVADWEQIKELSINTPPRVAGDLDFQACDWKIDVIENGKRKKVDAIEDILIGVYLSSVKDMLIDEPEVSYKDKLAYSVVKKTLELLAKRELEYLFYGLDWITKDILINEVLNDREMKCERCGISDCIHNAVGAQHQYELVDQKVLYYIGMRQDENNIDIFDPNYSFSLFDPRDSFEFARNNIPGEGWNQLFDKVKSGLVHSPEDTRDYFASSLLNNPKISQYVTHISWGEIWLKNVKIIVDEPFMLTKDEIGDLSYVENVDEIVRIVKNLYPEKVVEI